MADKDRKRQILALRRRFPAMKLELFQEIVTLFGFDDLEGLIDLLQEEEDKARALEEEQDRKIEERISQIRLSELHHEIQIQVPEGVDLEHVQAILVYGFAMPGQERVFAGRKPISLQRVRVQVRNKLLSEYDEDKFDTAFLFLVRNGALTQTGSKGSACSLNVHAKAKSVTPEGVAIIKAVKQFLRDHS